MIDTDPAEEKYRQTTRLERAWKSDGLHVPTAFEALERRDDEGGSLSIAAAGAVALATCRVRRSIVAHTVDLANEGKAVTGDH